MTENSRYVQVKVKTTDGSITSHRFPMPNRMSDFREEVKALGDYIANCMNIRTDALLMNYPAITYNRDFVIHVEMLGDDRSADTVSEESWMFNRPPQ